MTENKRRLLFLVLAVWALIASSLLDLLGDSALAERVAALEAVHAPVPLPTCSWEDCQDAFVPIEEPEND